MIKKTATTLEAKLCILMIGTLFIVLIGLGHLAMSEYRTTITHLKMEEFNSIAVA